MRGCDDSTATGANAIAVGVSARGIGQHDAGAVIVGEYHRAFMRTRRNHYLFRTHLPEAVARQFRIRLGEMIGNPLNEAYKILCEIAEGLRARQKCYGTRKAL